MKIASTLLAATAALTFLTMGVPAEAKGCIKGAAVGGVGGHFAGHHGLIGAVGGCVVGRHMANKKEKEAATNAKKAPAPSSSGDPAKSRHLPGAQRTL